MGAHLLFVERTSLPSSETGTRLEFFQGSFSIPITTTKRTFTPRALTNTTTKALTNTTSKAFHTFPRATTKALTNTTSKAFHTFPKVSTNTTTPKASNTTPKVSTIIPKALTIIPNALVRRGYSRRGASLFPKL
jgi:hypothetical protein